MFYLLDKELLIDSHLINFFLGVIDHPLLYLGSYNIHYGRASVHRRFFHVNYVQATISVINGPLRLAAFGLRRRQTAY